MKNFFYIRNKYLLASTSIWIASMPLPYTSLHLLTTGAFLYNLLERTELLEVDIHPDMAERKRKLAELLRHHLLKADDLQRWVGEDTLMIAKPKTFFGDSGISGAISKKFGLKKWEKQEFVMEVEWKDVKFYGSGTAFCVGQFVDLQNYYFKQIVVSVKKPRNEEIVILDRDSIDI